MIRKYMKKPEIVSAVQLKIGEKSMAEVMAFTNGKAQPSKDGWLTVPSPDCIMHAEPGDWVLKDARGRFFVLSHTMFTDAYDILPD